MNAKWVGRSRVLVLSTSAIALVLIQIHGSHQTSYVNATSTTQTCLPGIPYQKCHPGPLHPNPHPLPSKPPLKSPTAPALVMATSTFLPQMSALQQKYGLINVFRLSNTWVIVGSGQALTGPTTPPPAAPGGPLVAVDACHGNGTRFSACLSASSPHLLSDFTVVPLPDNQTPIQLETTFSRNLVMIGDGIHYGPIVLNLTNLHWYSAHDAIGKLAQNSHAYPPLTAKAPRLGIPLT